MKLPARYHHYLALLSTLGLPACPGSNGDDTGGASTTTLTTTDAGTTGVVPTTGDPTDSGTTASGTTGPEPTTGEVGDPAVYEQCKANNADTAKLFEAQCTCLVASGGFPDVASCVAEIGISPEEADCTCMVYARHPETKAVLDCLGPPVKTFLECYTKAGCEDVDAQELCVDAYVSVILECPANGEDVNNEVSFECLGETPFMCGSGEQVPESHKCDFSPDCRDGSDEVGCPGTFMCMNGSSIPEEYKCDGFLDCCEGDPECRDMSDEAGCPVFMCMNGDVVPESAKCDGAQDCEDGSDEVDCPVFMCMDGQQIPVRFECDGSVDCEDGSDEADCP